MVSIMLHVCRNNEKKIGVKPGDSRNETGQQPERNRAATGMKPSIYGKKGLLDQGAKQVRNDQKRPLGARETSRSLRGYYAVTTRSLRSLRGHYGHYAVTTRSLRGHYTVTTRSLRSLRSQKEHIFETEKTLNFAPKRTI